MRLKIQIGCTLFLFVLISSCSKGGSSGGGTPNPPPPPPEVEENIIFSIDPDPGSSTATAQSGTYTFKVNITSKLPSSGVNIDITTTQESNGSVLETKNIKSTVANNDINTGTLASGIVYKVNVKVSSQKTSTNSATKEFKVARK
jgi:hypothetical protein